ALARALLDFAPTGVKPYSPSYKSTYTLTAVDNTTDGPNGLPSVTSTLTLQGAEADTTVIERAPMPRPSFRLGHIAAPGVLTLAWLTLQGGYEKVNLFGCYSI